MKWHDFSFSYNYHPQAHFSVFYLIPGRLKPKGVTSRACLRAHRYAKSGDDQIGEWKCRRMEVAEMSGQFRGEFPFCINTLHIVRPPPFVHLEYLRQLCLTHPGVLYFHSTLCHEYILGFYLNQTATGSEKNFESTVAVLSHLWTLPYRSLNDQRHL